MIEGEMVALYDVAEVCAGNPAPQETSDFSTDGEPFVRMQDVGRLHHTRALSQTVDRVTAEAIRTKRLRKFPAGTLLIPKSGASIGLNHRALLARDCYVVSHLATVIPDLDRVDADFLYFWSLTYDPRDQAQTTSLPSLPLSLIKAARLPLPPLGDQRRAVDLLSRAEGIVQLRRRAREITSDLLPALFSTMFGDMSDNPRGWATAALDDVLESIDSGRSPRCLDRQRRGDEWGVLKLSALSGGRFDGAENKALPPGLTPLPKDEVHPGDLLISRKNTYELVGTSAYVWQTKGGLLLPDLIFRLRLRPGAPVDPLYLWQLLSTPGKRRALRQLAGGSAESMPNISKERLRGLRIELPPIDIQRQFSEKVKAVHDLIAQQENALSIAKANFDALLYRIFRIH
jgi:type I restriction enzyme S subunit